MLIPITRSSSASSPSLPPNLIKLGSTLLLLELQGSLEVSGTPEEGEAGGIVGELRMNGEKPMLQIGHHLLEGKIVTLPKPLAVLRKRSPPSSSEPHIPQSEEGTPPAKDEDEMQLEQSGEGGTSYEIVEVVRKKVVFARRPALVMGKPQAGAVKRP